MFVGKLEWKLGPGRIFGLDVSQQKMAVTVLHPNQDVQQYETPLNEDGLRAFLKDLRPEDRVVLEVTGNTWYLHEKIRPLVREVAVADPRKIKLIADSKAKTDRNDSYILAILMALGLLPTVWMPDPQTQGDRELLHGRYAVLGNLTRVKNQVRALLAQHGLTIEASDVSCNDAQLFLAKVGSSLPWPTQQRLASLLRQLNFCEGELRTLDAHVLVRAERWRPQLDLLLTIPGVSLLLAFTILSVIGTVDRFEKPKSLGNYTGAVPTLRASAEESWSGGITKGGPRLLRWALCEAVHSLVRNNGTFRNQYRRIKRNRKKRHGIAVMACARELAEVIWRMLKRGQTFQEVTLPRQSADEQPEKQMREERKRETAQRNKRKREQQKLELARKIHNEQPDPIHFIRANLDPLMSLAHKPESPIAIPADLAPTSSAPPAANRQAA